MKRRLLVACLALLGLALPCRAHADVDAARSYEVDELVSEGLGRTAPDTLTELLPRSLPTVMQGTEVIEFRRRVKNLALFDQVDVEPAGRKLVVRVRRKITIAPIVDFSSGKTLADSKVTLGAVEHDIDGHATRLGGKASYSERGLNFSAWLHEHVYRARRWAREQEVHYAGSGVRFEGADAANSWQRNRIGGKLEFISPSLYTTHWRYEFQLNAYHEVLTAANGPSQPQDGTYVGTTSELVYDRYTWNDLTPKGFRTSIELRPGIFLGAAEPRHELRIKILAGLPLGEQTALMFNSNISAVNAGNPNHSVLIGSQAGVRGLPDSLYRSRSQAYVNVEMRQSVEIASRWYVQGVVFSDAGVFEPMDALGTPQGARGAWSTGAGVRLLPTALVDTLLRLDVARLHRPFGTWFLQFGINQYF